LLKKFPDLQSSNAMSNPDEEARWIADAFHKFMYPDGNVSTGQKPAGYSLDGVPKYALDPIPVQSRAVTQGAGACATLASYLRESDPELSAKYLDHAEANYNYSGLWKIVRDAGEVGPREISAAAKCLWAEMYFVKLGKADPYEERLRKS